MTDAALAAVVRAQSELIAALDAARLDEVTAATARLSDALAPLRTSGAWAATGDGRALLCHATQQNEAARVRIRQRSVANDERLSRLAELRGRPAHGYGPDGRPRLRLI